MSTKIYNGFRFKNPDILTIRRQLRRLQPFVAAYTAEWKTTLLAVAVDGLLAHPEKRDAKQTLLSQARSMLEADLRAADKSMVRDGFDFKFEVTVIPVRRDLTLGMYFTEQNKLVELLESMPWFVDYHYQNQTDWPKDVPKKEWRQRELDWEEAIGDDAPARRGFTMSLHECYWFSAFDIPSDGVLAALVAKAHPQLTLADLIGEAAASSRLAAPAAKADLE